MTVAAKPAPLDLDAVNRGFDGSDPLAIIRWAVERFGDGLVMTSSFGVQSAVTLHLATRVKPDIPVIFVDTGYLFPETYKFADDLATRLNLNLKVYQSPLSPARMEATHGRLWEQGVEGMNKYDAIRKVEPMQRALRELGVTAWIAGLQAHQTKHRAKLRFVEVQDGIYKVHPILKWDSKTSYQYLKDHDLPYHPLFDQGYTSIGDVHTTAPVTAGMGDRDGRFGGLKQECGLHLPSTKEENESRGASDL